MSPLCVTHRGLFYSFSFPKPFISVRNPMNKQKNPGTSHEEPGKSNLLNEIINNRECKTTNPYWCILYIKLMPCLPSEP